MLKVPRGYLLQRYSYCYRRYSYYRYPKRPILLYLRPVRLEPLGMAPYARAVNSSAYRLREYRWRTRSGAEAVPAVNLEG